MGKGRAIVSLLVNGFFFFILPSLLFYWLSLTSSPLPGGVSLEVLNVYLPELIVPLFHIPVGGIEIPVGVWITLTSVLGLTVTFIAFISCLYGKENQTKAKVLGGIKYLVAIGWIWFYFDQLSAFLVSIDTANLTLLIHWDFYLITGMLMFLFLALANFFSATKEVEGEGKQSTIKVVDERELGKVKP